MILHLRLSLRQDGEERPFTHSQKNYRIAVSIKTPAFVSINSRRQCAYSEAWTLVLEESDMYSICAKKLCARQGLEKTIISSPYSSFGLALGHILSISKIISGLIQNEMSQACLCAPPTHHSLSQE